MNRAPSMNKHVYTNNMYSFRAKYQDNIDKALFTQEFTSKYKTVCTILQH